MLQAVPDTAETAVPEAASAAAAAPLDGVPAGLSGPRAIRCSDDYGIPLPDWDERGRFGGIRGRVNRVSLLPAPREGVNPAMGNPQLAEALVRNGPVMRTEIDLLPAKASAPSAARRTDRDGYRWTLSRGSSVFPIREGLTLKAHGYVEWRTPVSYVLPMLRNLTGSYRTLRQQERQDGPQLRQRGTLP